MAFRAAMFMGVPLSFSLSLDAGAVYQKLQGPGRAPEWNRNGQRSLLSTQGAAVWYSPAHAS
jgi:hypothetical protein